jgi:hypothetical protein
MRGYVMPKWLSVPGRTANSEWFERCGGSSPDDEGLCKKADTVMLLSIVLGIYSENASLWVFPQPVQGDCKRYDIISE